MEQTKTLSVADAGTALGVSSRTVRRWCKEGKLPAKKSGKSYLIGLDAVEQIRGSLKGKDALAREQEAVPDMPCAGGDGQITEATDEAESSFAEATEDKLASNAAVDSVGGDDGDVAGNGQLDRPASSADGQEQNTVNQLAGQVEKLQARIDRISQIVADRMKLLEKSNKRLSAKADNLKDGLGVMAVALAGVTLILTLVLVGHHTQYVHVPKWEHNLQQAAERREREAIEKRLAELEQTVTGLKNNRTSADRIIDADVQSMAATDEPSFAKATEGKLDVARELHASPDQDSEKQPVRKVVRVHELFQAVLDGK